MKKPRLCSRSMCSRPAVATVTFDYGEATAVIGPLSHEAQPHGQDLCKEHAESFTVPRGWQAIRLESNWEPAPRSAEDLAALAEAIVKASHNTAPRPIHRPPSTISPMNELSANSRAKENQSSSLGIEKDEIYRRGHLRVLRGGNEENSAEN